MLCESEISQWLGFWVLGPARVYSVAEVGPGHTGGGNGHFLGAPGPTTAARKS